MICSQGESVAISRALANERLEGNLPSQRVECTKQSLETDPDLEKSIQKDNDNNTESEEETYFDWKAWRHSQDGHQSSTSRTDSFSDYEDKSHVDDDFDADLVLAKLDEWEVMEEKSSHESAATSLIEDESESSSSTMSYDDDSDSSLSSMEEPDDRLPGNNSSPTLKHQSRSNSFVLRRHSLQHKSPLIRSPIGVEWKQWQKEKRRSGIWNRTVSQREKDGFPPDLNDDESNAPSSELTRSQSEKWNVNSACASGNTEDVKPKKERKLRRTQSLRLPDDKDGSDTPPFDWNAHRKDHKKSALTTAGAKAPAKRRLPRRLKSVG